MPGPYDCFSTVVSRRLSLGDTAIGDSCPGIFLRVTDCEFPVSSGEVLSRTGFEADWTSPFSVNEEWAERAEYSVLARLSDSAEA
mmetsp:Transcript_32879/g.79703  ORF Transcript_32879/g.79703 Transcript_32879/m.79703 type:complete len:85 (-) Transcript_32879:2322-2576(-)